METKIKRQGEAMLLKHIAEVGAQAVSEIGTLNDSQCVAAEKIMEMKELVSEALVMFAKQNVKHPGVEKLYRADHLAGEAFDKLMEVRV